MLNYSTHAIEDFSHLSTNLPQEDLIHINQITKLLHSSIKIELPPNGAIIEDNEKSYDLVTADMLHLPFPAVALEYPFTIFNPRLDQLGNIPIPKRIALCLEYEAHKDTPIGKTAIRYCDLFTRHGGIILIPIFFYPQLQKWTPAVWGTCLPRYYDETTLSSYYYGKDRKQARIGFRVFPILPTPARESIRTLGADKAIKDALLDNGEEVTSLIGLTAALSCSNVSLHTQPAPDKLNAKRVKSNKLPFYEYKVVMVDTHREVKVHKEGYSISDRQSPREHLRRGHIRRLASGRNTWVQASIVGKSSKGMIHKSYRVV